MHVARGCCHTQQSRHGQYVVETIQTAHRIQKIAEARPSIYSKTSSKGHIGDRPVVPCREVALFSEVFF